MLMKYNKYNSIKSITVRMFPLAYNKNLVHTIIEVPLLKSDDGSHFRQYYNRFILCTKKNLH